MKKLIYVTIIAVAFASCRDKGAEKLAVEQQIAIDSMKVAMEIQQEELARQKTIDSMNAIAAQNKVQVVHVAGSGTTGSGSATTTTAAEQKRKGMSGAAKGALIGAGAGAITGAVISKKKGEGALIGGLAGAVVGAGTGAVIDSKKEKK